ncbi:MAG: ribonuclease E/G [Rhodospirillales bacterium]|nr:ribonuclease E/G [Rhodospirillales bacterium]
MTVTLRVAGSPGEARVAVLRDGVLEDVAIWRPGAPDGVGDLHRGRIVALVPAMAGAFVALTEGEGFLPDTQGEAGQSEGDPVLVRVVRAARGGKGKRLARPPPEAASGFPLQGPPELLRRGPGAALDLAAHYPEAEVAIDDPALLARLRPALGARAVPAAEAFDAALEAELDALAAPIAALPGGGRLHIHPTPVLTAIDLDAGAATATRAPKARAQLAMNLAAIPELARQIRLRNLSGAILVDFAGMAPRARERLAAPLGAALAADPLRPRLLGFTRLGLAEILRPVLRPPLHEMLAGPHAAGLAALRALTREARARPGARLGLHASPSILAALEADPVALAEAAARLGARVTLRADPRLAGWEIAEPP